jgi:hypothetical protein
MIEDIMQASLPSFVVRRANALRWVILLTGDPVKKQRMP